MTFPNRVPLAALAAGLVSALALAGCGGGDGAGGDAAAFCRVAAEGQVGENPFDALRSRDAEEIETAMNRMSDLYDDLEDEAPDEISADVKVVGEVLDEIVDTLADHDYDIDAATPQLNESVGDAKILQRVSDSGTKVRRFVQKECPDAITTTSAQPTTTLSPANE